MLDLFPTSVLDNSILTSVLLGLLITWIFQETLGWNFTGLVVPGYLASIFAIQPATGAMVVVEAGMTYALVYLLSEVTPSTWPAPKLFGRDRFFALLLASVTVRLAVEGFGLELLAHRLGQPISPTLHSMGLLVMPLGANALWRTGMGRGVVRLGLPILLTYLILTKGLLPYTNLSLTSFELTYEDLAVDFVHSPKAYMLLLAGAWLGSVTNRIFGYDYGGIIVPGLLAVCWLWPARILTTFGEAFLVWGLLALLVRLPGLRRANLAGGRTLVLAFLSIYVVKFGIGWAVGTAWPGAKIHELFGFGYLLPTLMGLRLHKHGEPLRFTLPALACSLTAFLGASALGFALERALPSRSEVAPPPDSTTLVFAAYADRGPIPTRRQMLHTTSGGEGFGSLLRREDAEGPALIATVGAPGLAATVLELAPLLESRAVLLCGHPGPGCARGRRQLAREGPVWEVQAATASYLQARGDDLLGVDLERLVARVPDLRLKPGAREHTRLGLGVAARAKPGSLGPALPLAPLRADEEETPLTIGALRAIRHEIAPAMARFADGNDLALHLARRSSPWFGWDVYREGDTLLLGGPTLHAQVRRGGHPVVVHVPDAHPPGLLPLAWQLAIALEARALVVDAPPSILLEEDSRRRPAFALLTGLLEAWPDAQVVELRGVRDIYDLGGSWGWSDGQEGATPPVVETVEALLGTPPVRYGARVHDQVLRRNDTPLRHAQPHVVLQFDTRLRHRFIAFQGLDGLERRWAHIGPLTPPPAWALRWTDALRDLDERRLQRLAPRLERAGIRARLRCTRTDPCNWIEIERCTPGEGCSAAWFPRYRGLPEGAPAMGADPVGRP